MTPFRYISARPLLTRDYTTQEAVVILFVVNFIAVMLVSGRSFLRCMINIGVVGLIPCALIVVIVILSLSHAYAPEELCCYSIHVSISDQFRYRTYKYVCVHFCSC